MNVLLHYQRCTFVLVAARKNALKDLSAAVWGFMPIILQTQRRRMLYLCLPRDSLGHCISCANNKDFSEPNLPVY